VRRRSSSHSAHSNSRSERASTQGEVESDGARVHGVAVHLGARIAAAAGPSQVLVSSTVRDLSAGSGLAFEDAGEQRLKGFRESWHLYAAR
jgi:class 3 adenylate cyclase